MAGSSGGGAAAHRRRPPQRRSFPTRAIALLVLAIVAVVAVVLVVRAVFKPDHRPETAKAFAAAWSTQDYGAMWNLLDAKSQAATSRAAFAREYRSAYRQSTLTSLALGALGPVKHGEVRVPVTVKTQDFGTLRGSVALPVHEEGETAKIAWTPALRLPGLRGDEQVRRRQGAKPTRASIYDASGRVLNSDPTGASIAGTPAQDGKPATGLERIYDERLAGRPSETLRFGSRTIASVKQVKPRSLHTTIHLGLQDTALAALNGALGGIAVIDPNDGAVEALAGLAVSALQPPGSTFKIITLAAALEHGVATPSSSYPEESSTTLSGVKLANANNETCGGSLASSFADSCNSVFAPLGAKLGAGKLVDMAERFGFNEPFAIPAAKTNSIPQPSELGDSLAVGSSAIGQNKDQATPLGMAAVGATIANHGVHISPRIVATAPLHKRRAVSTKVAGQVRDMMLGVVSGGTGTAAAIPGVEVAGKTGTAELKDEPSNGTPDPENTDAWFVAFAPADHPKVAVAVMLVSAGAGGTAAAPIARTVLEAALQ